MSAYENDLTRLSPAAQAFLRRDHAMFIGGQRVAAKGGKRRDVIDPSTGEAVASVPEADANDVEEAVRAARQAFESGAWPSLKAHQREALMLELARRLQEHGSAIAEVES